MKKCEWIWDEDMSMWRACKIKNRTKDDIKYGIKHHFYVVECNPDNGDPVMPEDIGFKYCPYCGRAIGKPIY